MKAKKGESSAFACQLRGTRTHPFGALHDYVPMRTGEDMVYRELREAVPVLDAAVSKIIDLAGGFSVRCPSAASQASLEAFLREVSCGNAQYGIDNFLTGYLGSLLTYGRAVGEIVVSGGHVRAVCWGDVTRLQIRQASNGLDAELWGPGQTGEMEKLPYQNLLLFSTHNPEPEHPYGVSLFRGMPFLADILMKIYTAVGSNWERAGNVRYSVICRNNGNADASDIQERGRLIAAEWAKAMEDSRTGAVRDFVAVGDVEIKVIGGETEIPDCQVPLRQILEQLIAKTGLPPFLLGINWSTTERMSAQQADILTTELWALRRSVEPVVRRICKTYLALEGLDTRTEIVWGDISLQDVTEEAKADLYHAQAERIRAEAAAANEQEEKA